MDELLQGDGCSLSNLVVEVVHEHLEALQRIFEMRREQALRVLREITQRHNRRSFDVHHRGSNSNDGLAREGIVVGLLALRGTTPSRNALAATALSDAPRRPRKRLKIKEETTHFIRR